MKTTGIILIAIGILMFIFPAINYTQEKKLVDAGPLQINKKEHKTLGWPTYAGGIALAAGVILLLSSKKKAD